MKGYPGYDRIWSKEAPTAQAEVKCMRTQDFSPSELFAQSLCGYTKMCVDFKIQKINC